MKALGFLLFVYAPHVWSLPCHATIFQNIDEACIEKQKSEFKSYKFPATNLKTGDIVFYVTDQGNWGKILVHDSEIVPNKTCTVYFDYETYQGKKSHLKSASTTIHNYLGIWDSQEFDLDNSKSETDFILKNEKNNCILETQGAKFYKAGNYNPNDINERSLLFYASIFLIGISVFILAKNIFQEEEEFRSGEAIEETESLADSIKKEGFILKYSRPFFKRYFTPIVKGMKSKNSFSEKYKRALASAGLTKSLSPIDLMAFKLFLIIGFPIFYLVIRELVEAQWPMAFVPVISVLGYIYPDIWLRSMGDKRKNEIVYHLPFAVDMLALSVEAGLDFMAAITRVIQKAPKSALVDEFEIVIKEVQLGATRSQALKQLAWRVDSLPLTSFCATLIAADSVGASIGPILKALSGEIRSKRSAIIEKKGASASVKLQLPMFAFILPAILIIIMAPMILTYLN
ncbi:MAG: type II secretion system F family protein [Halobacteriovoraceae bacterium]|nr:type II secretion system F family protein [Halobacteriovoraceae bacterium]